MSVRTRFAPSPTGSLHVGGVRTALYCLLHARKHEGKFILRIEDTDRARSTEESTQGIQEDLLWLELGWDEGPVVGGDFGPYSQSERLELYNKHVNELLASDRAYLAWDSKEELGQQRKAAMAKKETFRYHRKSYTDDQVAQFKADGRTPVVRLMAPDRDITVHDTILGEVTIPASDHDDIIIRKADGFPTYHFAVVVDDHYMEVSHVLRGQEHLMNTPKHQIIYEALGWEPPRYGHLPLIFNPSGSKMSKRDKAKVARLAARNDGRSTDWEWLAEATSVPLEEMRRFMKKKNDDVAIANAIAEALEAELPMIEVLDFRRGGYLPEALLNYLALLGWSPGDDRELMSFDELIEAFTLERVNRTAARFDFDKLTWMNAEYMRSMSDDDLSLRLDQYLEVAQSPLKSLDSDRRLSILKLFRSRAQTFADLDKQCRFLFERPSEYNQKATKKHLLKKDGFDHLAQCSQALQGLTTWDVVTVQSTIESLIEISGSPMGTFAQPLRIALTGGPVSPPIYDTLVILPQEEAISRINACIQHFRKE
ncbi:MAG: glutamate--tRNA ligase [Proteobacteria bacterium]|nr:glutamate--tRNA ligase [Pseudomonadota bacterium]